MVEILIQILNEAITDIFNSFRLRKITREICLLFCLFKDFGFYYKSDYKPLGDFFFSIFRNNS